MFWRGLRGAVLGASTGALITGIVTVLLLGPLLLMFSFHDQEDRCRELSRLTEFLPMAALAGVVVGAIGGFAAKLSGNGPRLLTSMSIVGACSVVGRLLVVMLPRYKGSPEPSWIPVLTGAVVGGIFVTVYSTALANRGTPKAGSDKGA